MTKYRSLVVCLLAGLFLISGAPPCHAQTKRGIRSVDFRNFTYEIAVADGSVTSIVLRNGKNMAPGVTTSFEYGDELQSIKYVDFDGDGNDEALIAIHSDMEAAGAVWTVYYFVYAYRNGSPVQVFQENRYKPQGIRVVGKSLVITAPFWREQDPNCCPYATETTVYRWRRNAFARVSRRLKRMR